MKGNAGKIRLDSKEMFTLGFLHNIVYEFDVTLNHNKLGSELLKNKIIKILKKFIIMKILQQHTLPKNLIFYLQKSQS